MKDRKLIAVLFGVAALLASLASSVRPAIAAPFPGLGGVVDKAKLRGPAALLAAADLDVATSLRPAAGLPSLTNPYFEILIDRSKLTQGVAISSALYVPLEIAGQRDKRLAEVDALVKWKELSRGSAGAGAVGLAVVAYGEALVAAESMREAARGEGLAHEEVDAMVARLSAGDATALDLALVNAELARWSQAHADAEVSLALALARLSLAIGEPKTEAPPPSALADLPAIKWKDADALVAYLGKKSPTLLAAKVEAGYFEAAKEKWEVEKYAPLNLILLAGRGDLGDVRYGAGLAWTFPILRKNQAEIAKAEAEKERALVNAGIVEKATAARAFGSFDAYAAALRAISSADATAIPAAEAVVAATVAGWKAGKVDYARILLARRDLAQARTRRLEVLATGWRAYGELAGLLGALP